MKIISGKAFESDDEVIIDDFKAHQEIPWTGDTMEVFGKDEDRGNLRPAIRLADQNVARGNAEAAWHTGQVHSSSW